MPGGSVTRVKSARGERGSSLVEMAISIAFLLTLVGGAFEICFAFYTYHTISDIAREATRYAMVRGSSCSGSTGCPATQASILSYVQASFPGVINTSSTFMTLTATWPDSGSVCTPNSSPCNNPGNHVKVTITYKFPLTIPFITATTITMSSSSEMVISS